MTAPTSELTRNPVDGSWGYICTEHGLHRYGLPEQHARNVEAKHLREDHADPLVITLNLTAAAQAVAESRAATKNQNAMAVWCALTGLSRQAALELMDQLLIQGDPIYAAVAPF